MREEQALSGLRLASGVRLALPAVSSVLPSVSARQSVPALPLVSVHLLVSVLRLASVPRSGSALPLVSALVPRSGSALPSASVPRLGSALRLASALCLVPVIQSVLGLQLASALEFPQVSPPS